MKKYLGMAALAALLSAPAFAAEITPPPAAIPAPPNAITAPSTPGAPTPPGGIANPAGATAATPGKPIDYATASVQELTPAAEKGDVKAQFALAEHYGQRNSLDADYSVAQKWYEKAANQGNHEAQYKLGVMYQDALGVSQSIPRAYYWVSLAATGGSKMYAGTKAELEKKLQPAQVDAITKTVGAFKPSTGDAPAEGAAPQ
jgi:hypothetical protein